MTGRAILPLGQARGLHVKAARFGTEADVAQARSDLLAARLKHAILKALNESPGTSLDADQVGQLSGLLLGRIDPPNL